MHGRRCQNSHPFTPPSNPPFEILRSPRDAPPAHCTFRIESFSLLPSLDFETYVSGLFEAGGYKWKLSLYPNGNKNGDGEGHISLYLVIADTKALPLGWEVNVNFKMFVYDHSQDKYLTIQDGRVRRYSKMRTEWGFDQLISRDNFNDPRSGYIFKDDSCVFGAEVFVIKSTGRKDECLSMIKYPRNGTFTWKIDKFSAISKEYLRSDVFVAGDRKWNLWLFPEGSMSANGLSLSLYFELADNFSLPSEIELYMKYNLRIQDQAHHRHSELEGQGSFSTSSSNHGFPNFLALKDLKDMSKGFIVRDRVIVQAEILALFVFKDLKILSPFHFKSYTFLYSPFHFKSYIFFFNHSTLPYYLYFLQGINMNYITPFQPIY